MAERVVVFGEKVPPTFEDQIPPVADPPTLPESCPVEALWQMVWSVPAFIVGVARTVMFTEDVAAGHKPTIPVVVNVNVAVPLNPLGGVQVEFKEEVFGVNVPPDKLDQRPPVAVPPTVPIRLAELP